MIFSVLLFIKALLFINIISFVNMTYLDFETENPWVENDLIVLSIINNASAYAL